MDEGGDPEDEAEVKMLYEYIEEINHLHLESYTKTENGRHQLLKLMGRPRNADNMDYPNMLIFSIERNSYTWASSFLEILQHSGNKTKASDLLLNHNRENCFKSLLSSEPSHQLALAEQSSNGKQKPNNQESLFRKLLSFQDVVDNSVMDPNFFLWMLEKNREHYVLRMLKSLSLSKTSTCLSQKVPNKDSRGKHVLESNLFMLVFEKCKDTGAIKQFVEIVQSLEKNHKCELVLGRQEPDISSDFENCLRTAARTGQVELAMEMLLVLVPVEKQIKALLEVGPNDFSLWTQLLKTNSLPQIKRFFDFVPAEEKNKKAFLLRKVENLQEAFQDPELKYFKHAKMSLEAVKLLTDKVFCSSSFLIPRPGLSQPFALIYYNTFKQWDDYDISFAQKEAEDLRDALQELNWPNDSIVLHSDWTVNELHESLDREIEDRKKNCSIFVLSILSHGSAGKVMGNDSTEDDLQLIIDKLGNLPDYIPKVAILDTCAVEVDSTTSPAIELKTNNTVLLKSTVRGGTSKKNSFYIHHLASQIREADGVTSLYDMHMEAAKLAKLCSIDDPSNVDDRADNSLEATSANASIQVPVEASTARHICLSNFGHEYDKCQKCKGTVEKFSGRHITCQRCAAPYHLDCVQLKRRHMVALKAPGFMWFCSYCHEKVKKGFP